MEKKSIRNNLGKPKWSLIHFKSLIPMVRVLEFGENKYSRDNWKIGLDLKEIEDSMHRHLNALADGEIKDKESGIYHIGHIMCNCMFWMYHYLKNKKNAKEEKREG